MSSIPSVLERKFFTLGLARPAGAETKVGQETRQVLETRAAGYEAGTEKNFRSY
jgi:hypothetical protein